MSVDIITLCGGSGNGKTFLANKLIKEEMDVNDFIIIDMEGKTKSYLLEEFGSFKSISNKNSSYIFNKLRYADPSVDTIIKSDDGLDYIAVLNDGSKKELDQISNRYVKLLSLYLAIKNKKNIIVDNFDLCFTGSGFKNIINSLIIEILNNKNKVVFTFTDMSLWQLFSLSIPKEVNKKFYLTKYMFKDKTYDHIEVSYKDLAFTLSYLYDKEVRKELESKDKKKQFRPSDTKSY